MADTQASCSEQVQPTAMEELARDPASRQRFLKMMGGAGAASAFSVFLAACGGGKQQQEGTSTQPSAGAQADLKIVNYALTLEHVEADFYKKVVASGLFKGKQLELLKSIGQNEQEHVSALTATVEKLGGKPAAKPKTNFPLTDAKTVANLASVVENLGASAYLGQAARIKSKEVLAAALSIHTVEARHAAALGMLVGKPVTPDGAFAKPASMSEVLPKVKPFIVG